ncbi:DUF4442 domain-containing protein [Herbidospora yilanensis]|uniref:DUF4442 domain-containing protein n=1 Tax=Herbidospora yilanensis TaxID=354426 RepID=UPI000B04ED74|nr:DUF4442 domain-containing protein [Herbidospora yilanensis]
MTTFDTGALFLQSVPFARTLGVSFDSVDSGTAVARLADRPDLHNHVGGPHAGVVFSLAESASGAAMLSLFGDTLDRATPLATVGRVAYRKLALGDLTAEAVVRAERDAVLAELASQKRPEFTVEVTVRDSAGVTVAEVTVEWTLRPNR